MPGSDVLTGSLFSFVDIEQRISAKYPLLLIRELVNDVLVTLDAEFAEVHEGSTPCQERSDLKLKHY